MKIRDSYTALNCNDHLINIPSNIDFIIGFFVGVVVITFVFCIFEFFRK